MVEKRKNMGYKKRVTDKIVIFEGKSNNRVILKKNLGWFKNLFSTVNTFSTKFREKVQLTAFLGIGSSLIGIVLAFLIDATTLGEYTRAAERINSIYSPEVAQTVIEQTVLAPTSIGPWVAVFGGAVMLISLTAIIISIISRGNNSKAEPHYIEYDKSINSDFFAAIPNELFEQFYSVSQSIQETENAMSKLEKALKKPMTDFLKKDVLKQLEILREKKTALIQKRSSIYQKTTDILEKVKKADDVEKQTQEELKRWNDKKKNDSEILEILGELASAQEAVNDVAIVENSKLQHKDTQLSAR